MRVEFTNDEANVVLNLIKQGLASLMRSPEADGAIDSYVMIRNRIVEAAKAEQAAANPEPETDG